jgi:hypothetical protein
MKSMFKGAFGALIVVLALSGLTAASALAAGAPIVETTKAAGVTETTAVLNGTVNPNGIETNVYAEYGPTTSYGSSTKEHNAGAGTKIVGESWNASKLTPNTTYHFRVVATNANKETSYGTDLQFFTGAYPPGLPEFSAAEGKVTELSFERTWSGGGWEVANGDKSWACGGGTFVGSVTGAKSLTGKMTFTNCKSGMSGCRSAGAAENEVRTAELEGNLVYLSRSAKTVALNLKAKTGELVIPNFTCFGISLREARGSILVPVTYPINKRGSGLQWGRLEAVGGLQVVREYEKEAGVKVRSVLETNFPGPEWTTLGWDIPEGVAISNKEYEIKA